MAFSLKSAAIGIAFSASLQFAVAQSDASALSAISTLPIASVVGGVAASAVAIPVALSTAGAVLVVKSVEVSARGTVYVLERVSDGARVSIEVTGKVAGAASVAVGTTVTVITFGAGALLSVAGEAITFLPNELGKKLLYTEKLTK